MPAPPEIVPTEAEAPPLPNPVKPAPLPTLRSDDGRVVLTATSLAINGTSFSFLELEAVELTPVRWLLWYLLGGLTLAGFAIAFLQNWLRTLPAMIGLATGALLLAYGRRGTNRLRVHRLGREATHFALPGELEQWQKLTAEANRRIRRAHDEAAAAAAMLLDAPSLTPPDSGTFPSSNV
ncbi:hypothetical protein [Hymenobacter sp. GOD-10R]|uniref:hypothetical protein n=1 Tax=Hymenobacter sp. GOD-10R TaxID=3093922 RepID=UPI002D79FD8F|nr:hypothetical protein [Hymenobacter sp. GOD-10R]WRQ26405.1 hypothetical protein SD425_15095 [Hymenobacter sp. GOD-10R]